MGTLKNIFKVALSNITTIIAGVFVSFFLPKIISISDYGFYKVFSLYFNYLGVLSLGIVDGIVLKYGDKDYAQLDREKFRSIFFIYTFLHTCFAFLLVLVSLILFQSDYRFILLMLAGTLIPTNFTGYFQQLSQITQRFKEYSLRKIIQSILNIVFIIVLFFFARFNFLVVNYKIYIIGSVFITVLLSFWYVITYRDIVFGKKCQIKDGIKEVIELIRIGFPLLIANLCSTLLLSLDRQFVSVLFSTEEYATYAFAYSLLSLITVAVSSISAVIYPLFKRYDKKKLIDNYGLISKMILIFVFLMTLAYNPLCLFVEWFLPKYSNSLQFFRIILPSISLSSVITAVIHNYYKVLGKSFSFFLIGIITLIISSGLNFVAFYLFKTREAISIASVVSTFLWYLMTSFFIRKECKFSYSNLLFIIMFFFLFYLSTCIELHWISFVVQIIFYFIFLYVFSSKDLKNILTILKKQ